LALVDLNPGFLGCFKKSGIEICSMNKIVWCAVLLDDVVEWEFRDGGTVFLANEMISLRD
jgi:hypothetical protein